MRSFTIYNQATSTIHRKALITVIIIKKIFYETTPYNKQCLASCGYNNKLTYQQQGDNNYVRKNRKCNIIQFNSSYSKSHKTNIGKYIFRLLNNHFPPSHKLCKIFNKNTLKPSYSCMANLKANIDEHSKKIVQNTRPPKTKLSLKRLVVVGSLPISHPPTPTHLWLFQKCVFRTEDETLFCCDL